MKTITLIIDETEANEDLIKALEGKKIVGSVGCSEHDAHVLVIAPESVTNAACVLSSLNTLATIVVSNSIRVDVQHEN
jgi:CO dehydrogenase/acetyl-CoA synthase delta subunit